MMIGGTRDGVIAESGHRYGIEDKDPLYLLRRTFERGVTADRDEAWMVELEGANHFSMAYPLDTATGRPFLDWPEEGDSDCIRSLLGWLIAEFASYCVGRGGVNPSRFEDNKLINLSHRQCVTAIAANGARDV